MTTPKTPTDERHQQQRPPVADAEIVEQHPGDEGAHHVLRAVREIDDVEQAEDDRQPETEQGVEGAVDQAEQQLPEQCLRRNSQKLEHRRCPARSIGHAGVTGMSGLRVAT